MCARRGGQGNIFIDFGENVKLGDFGLATESTAGAPHRGSLHPLLHASEIVARDSGLALDYVWRDVALLRVSTSSRKRPADAVAPFVECHKPTDAPQWTEICDLARLRRRVDGKEAEL